MGDRDQKIGANVARARGDQSQKELADKMRSRGHKWSQSTVWSVEKGDRPLRLTEAEDLASVLRLRSIEALARDPQDMRVIKASFDVSAAGDALAKAVATFRAKKAVLTTHLLAGGLVDEDVRELGEVVDTLTLDDAIQAGLWLNGEADDSFVPHESLLAINEQWIGGRGSGEHPEA